MRPNLQTPFTTMALLGVARLVTTAYYRKSNSQADLMNHLVRYLKSFMVNTTPDWVQYIGPLNFSYNTGIQLATKHLTFQNALWCVCPGSLGASLHAHHHSSRQMHFDVLSSKTTKTTDSTSCCPTNSCQGPDSLIATVAHV